MAQQKYQHYVPQTYLNKWVDSNNQVHVYDKNGKLNKSGKTKKILGINDLYTKGVGDLLVCNNHEREEIFKCLDGYSVYHNNEKLEGIEDFSRKYYCFNEWIIRDENGKERSKNSFRNDIEQVRILNIENLLSRIENKWNNIYNSILNFINGKISEENFLNENMEDLKKFIFIQDWRTIDKKKLYRDLVDNCMSLLIDNDDRFLNEIDNEFSSCLFLSNIEEFIKGSSDSPLNKNYEKFKMAHMKIFLATANKNFLTNDNPVLYVNCKKLQDGIYYPISPKIILGFVKGNYNKISIEQMPVNSIREINKIIKKEANELYISSKNELSK